jgi:hypothetical protein
MIRSSILCLVLGALAGSQAWAGTTPAKPSAPSGVSSYGKTPNAAIIFDQGPSKGSNGGCWSNSTQGQNFSDAAPLAAGTSVTGINIITCIPPTAGTVTFKAVNEDTKTALYTESGVPSSWVDNGDGTFTVSYLLQGPFVVPAGVNVGYGLSGDGFELGQTSVLSPADGLMSQYSGQVFNLMTEVGDQMFQLLGGSRCDVNGDGKYSVADLLAFLRNCNASGGSQCFIQTIRLARECGSPTR